MADLVEHALATLADVKETLGITDNSKDNLIIRKINQATEIIEGYCLLPYNHHFQSTSYSNEEYDATGTDTLVLKMHPVSSVSRIDSRDSSLNEAHWSAVDTEYYFLDKSSGIMQLNFRSAGYHKRYRVSYTAGYDEIPSDLTEACVTLASFMVDNGTSGQAIRSKREGQREIQYFDTSSKAGDNPSLINQLGLDEVLNRYVMQTVYEQ